MTDDELKKVVEALKANNSEELASFGIYDIGNGDEFFIRANKGGLQLFAAQIIQASFDDEKIIEDKENNIISLEPGEKWKDEESDIPLFYIELVKWNRPQIPKLSTNNSDLKEKAYMLGCGIATIFGVICFITGLVVIFKHFTN